MTDGDPCVICSSLDTHVGLDWDEPILICHSCGYNT